MDEGPTTVAQFCYVAFKSCHPALDAAFGAERHITTGATLRIMIGIGGRLTAPPLPHHRAYGSRTTAVRLD
jgi:hypothetical protein